MTKTPANGVKTRLSRVWDGRPSFPTPFPSGRPAVARGLFWGVSVGAPLSGQVARRTSVRSRIRWPVRPPWGLYPHGSNNNIRGSAAAGPAASPGSGRLVSQRQDELGLRGREDRPLALPSGRPAYPLHAPHAR